MALPTKVKTWSIDPCNRETAATLLEAMGDCLLGIKNALKLMSGVSVKGSCNGVTGAMDGVDRWVASSDVQTRFNGTAGAQSWIVLDLANMGGVELLMTYNAASQQGFSFYFSPGGNYVVAGTSSHKPTATDEVTIQAGGSIMTTSGTADRLWTTWVSSDGAALMFAIAEAGAFTSFVALQQVTNRISTPAWLVGGVVGFSIGTQVGHTGLFSVWGTTRPVCRINPGAAVNVGAFFGTEGAKVGLAPSQYTNVAELQGSGHNLFPVSIWSETATVRGAVGTFIDIWCGNTAANDGDTYPNDATRLWMQISDFVVPWDGSAVAMT